MAVYLDRIDAAPPIDVEGLDYFIFWLAIFIDSLNESLQDIESKLNSNDDGLIIPSFTSAEILTLSVNAENGTAWYAVDATPPNVVLKINGALVQLTTAPFP